MRQYFNPCVQILSEDQPDAVEAGVREEAFLTVAKYCDEQYQRLKEHMESPEFRDSIRIQEKLTQEAQQM